MKPFAPLLVCLLAGAVSAGEVLPRQVLEQPSPDVEGAEFSRRLLSPIAADDVARFLQSQGRGLAPEPFAPGRETVDMFVPSRQPEGGYGLVVFIPPMDEFTLPADWRVQLERRGLAFVSLRGAGNEADVIGRRIPLALHARHFAARRLALDPERTYIAGFSGGARLAQRIALAWPDVFAGSLQFAGSVRVGENRLPPPPRELMARLEARSRFVLVSGTLDLPNRRNDALALETLRGLCVASAVSSSPARLEHWVPDGRALGRALDQLEAVPAPDPARPACIARRDATIAAELAAATALLEAGQAEAARAALVGIDDRHGGLAAPASVELARRILARLPGA